MQRSSMNIIEKKIYTDGELYYLNPETKEKYGEIVGGLAWPGIKDGFLVIAAVDLFENTQLELATLGSLRKRVNQISTSS